MLSNALRYTPVGETISVTIHEAERTVTLSVENPGGTIEPEHLDKLFIASIGSILPGARVVQATLASAWLLPDLLLRPIKAESGAPH